MDIKIILLCIMIFLCLVAMILMIIISSLEYKIKKNIKKLNMEIAEVKKQLLGNSEELKREKENEQSYR